MKIKFIEATQSVKDGPNWGKFMVARFTAEEWAVRSVIGQGRLLVEVGFHPGMIWVFDLQTCEGAAFLPAGGAAHAKDDLDKHRIWVCVLFQPFLEWLYAQDLTDLDSLPAVVEIPDAPFGFYGHRRPGNAQEKA